MRPSCTRVLTALAVVALAAPLLTGCTSTHVRRTTWTLGSFEPLRVGDSLSEGEFRAEAAVETSFPRDTGDSIALQDESALYVNQVAGTLSFFGAMTDAVELGGGLTLAAPAWSRRTSEAAEGPTPEGTVGRVAVGLRGNLPVADDAAHVSILTELGSQWGRTNRWTCNGLIECQTATTRPPDTARGSTTVDGFLGIHGDYDAHPVVTPYAYLGMGMALVNQAVVARYSVDGVTNDAEGNGIYPDLFGMAGFGADFKVGPGRFRLGTMIPFGAAEHGFGPSVTASVGVIGGRTDDDAEPAAAE